MECFNLFKENKIDMWYEVSDKTRKIQYVPSVRMGIGSGTSRKT